MKGEKTMETSLGRRCIICGAIIDDNNPDGIGCSCREAYNIAKYRYYTAQEENAYKLWEIETSIVMPLFLEKFEGTKFRSGFRKKFYPSIKEQWNEKKRVSRKQLDICVSMLTDKIDINEMYADIQEQKKNEVDDFMKNFLEYAEKEEIKEFRKYIDTSRGGREERL